MYEMTCGSCGNVMKTPFARNGAMVPCAKCGARFAVTPQSTRRVVGAVAGVAQADVDLLPQGQAAAAPVASAAPPAVAVERTVPRAMRRPSDVPRPTPTPTPTPVSARELALAAAVEEATPPMRPRVVQRDSGTKWAVIGMAAVSIVALLAMVALFKQQGEPASTSPGGTEIQNLAMMDSLPELKRVEAVPIPAWEWSDDPLPQPATGAPLRFENQTSLVNPQTGRVILRGRIELESFDIYENCILHLRLLDRDGLPVARAQVELHVLNGQRPRDISVEIPPEMFQKMQSIQYSAEVTTPPVRGAAFDEVISTPSKIQQEHTAVKITAFNTLTTPITRALFMVTAYNSVGEVQGQWTTSWPGQVDARQRIEFAIILPVDMDKIAQWEVLGAGVVDSQP